LLREEKAPFELAVNIKREEVKYECNFFKTALAQYINRQTKDRKMLKRINEIIVDIERNGLMGGIGKLRF